MSRAERAAVIAAMAAWYLLAFMILRPLADAPVVDSWIYAHAVRVFSLGGGLRFAGYTQAMPVAQVIYGVAWSRLFGASPKSLDLSVAVLGALGAAMFYALLRRCGAGIAESGIATGLLAANPCYMFLSFSFMTEIPFVVLLIAAFLAFSCADGPRERLLLWLSAALLVGAFLVRPFAVAAIVGFAGSTLVYDLRPPRLDLEWLKHAAPKLAPFAAALLVCALAWIWLTVLEPKPWMLQLSEQHLEYFLDVPPASYLRAGLLAPLLYLGLVLSPLALVQLSAAGLRRAGALTAAIFVAASVLLRLDPTLPATPELTCYGGWGNALLLHGLPTRFSLQGPGQWTALVLSSLSAAGLVLAAQRALKHVGRATVAVMLTSVCYWMGTIPLWLFNDRYYLVLVPSGCLLLARAPLRRATPLIAASIAMTAALAWFSLAGVYDYQRGLSAVVAARDALERAGVPRAAIDAGYSLNGADLYRYADESRDTYELERGIPMITSAELDEYTIAATPIAGTAIVWRFRWPGPLGFGSRELYVLRRVRPQPPDAAASTR